MSARADQAATIHPSKGVLIPSPVMSHTHAMAFHPFDPDALLTVEGKIGYSRDYALNEFPLEQQAMQHAGQIVVAREMAELRLAEVHARHLRDMPEVNLDIYQNPKAKPLGDCNYWRDTLGWIQSLDTNRRNQYNRYSTLVPAKSRLLRGVYDKYTWDHELGDWKKTTHSGVQEALRRREWVCKELERIDMLRYEVMADWKRNTQKEYLAGLTEDSKRARRTQISKAMTPDCLPKNDSDNENNAFTGLKRVITASLDQSDEVCVQPDAKKPRCSVKAPVELPPLEIADSQSTLSSVSHALLASADDNHEFRSQNSGHQSPTEDRFPHNKETTAELLKRYPFLLDIPTAGARRRKWIGFLEKHRWNRSMLSAMRKFFMADIAPNTTQTMAFLKKLEAVCATIKDVDNGHAQEKRYKLLWDTLTCAEAPMEAASTYSVQVSSDPEVNPGGITISPTASQVCEAAATEKVQFKMRKHVATLTKGDLVEPPCDRCRKLSLECRINKTSCKMCAESHNRCTWSEVKKEELKSLVDSSPVSTPRSGKKWTDVDLPAVSSVDSNTRREKRRSRLSVGKRRSSGPLGDGEDTRIFLDEEDEDAEDDHAIADGDGTRMFLAGSDKMDSGEDEEDEYSMDVDMDTDSSLAEAIETAPEVRDIGEGSNLQELLDLSDSATSSPEPTPLCYGRRIFLWPWE